MSVYGTNIKQFFAPTEAYYQDLSLQVKQQGEENLAKTQAAIEQKAALSSNTVSSSSTTMYVVLGLAAIALVTLAILKRKKII
jgi:LPXTG-motif cell wall-anchored protein